MMTCEQHLASLPCLDGMARAAFRQAWTFGEYTERERIVGLILAAAGTPMCATDAACVGCGCRSLTVEEAIAELKRATRPGTREASVPMVRPEEPFRSSAAP